MFPVSALVQCLTICSTYDYGHFTQSKCKWHDPCSMYLRRLQGGRHAETRQVKGDKPMFGIIAKLAALSGEWQWLGEWQWF